MRYLVKIFFKLDKSISCFPQLQIHWCVTINNGSMAIFVNMQEVRGWDMTRKVNMVKTQLKVTHAPDLTFNIRNAYCDLSSWRHTLFQSCFDFLWLDAIHFCFAHKKATELLLIVTHQWFCTWGRQDVNLAKK